VNNEIFNVDLITSKSNSTIVKIGKLETKKYRYEEQLFVCNGIKLFLEAAKYGAKIRYIVLKNSADFEEKIIKEIKAEKLKGADIICVSDEVFEKLSEENSPQGIICVCQFMENMHTFSTTVKNVNQDERVIILESIRDPGNLGTIIRNAVAFGFDKIILSSDCADIYSSKVIRSAMGATFKIKIDIVSNIVMSIIDLRTSGYNVLGAALIENSKILGEYQISPKDIFVIGNEGHGLSSQVIEACDDTVYIPMCDNTESLNAGMAAGIIMWEQSKLYNIL
jgi:TrmH family RNA methyltransferase